MTTPTPSTEFPAHFRWGLSGPAAGFGCAHELPQGPQADDAAWLTDLDGAQRLGANAYRFSLSWPRVVPDGKGPALGQALGHYSRLVDGLLQRGLQPWATLFAGGLPLALQAEGGWGQRNTVGHFLDYTDAVSRRLGDRVHHWVTQYEPERTARAEPGPAVTGNPLQAPQDEGPVLQAAHHLLLSHGLAVPLLRANAPGSSVGLTLDLQAHRLAATGAAPAGTRRGTHLTAAAAAPAAPAQTEAGLLGNDWFLDPLHGRGYPEGEGAGRRGESPHVRPDDLALIAVHTDFLGVSSRRLQPVPTAWRGEPGVAAQPFGLADSSTALIGLLGHVHRLHPETGLLVCEEGAPCSSEPMAMSPAQAARQRQIFWRHRVAACLGMAAGVPLLGYFANPS